ncbi:MAG: hypothetical protein JNN09_09405, partial [Alphaproteobacteria bacterium]|nr:hypothetical protein [Alphaproteobacteria bacterium]
MKGFEPSTSTLARGRSRVRSGGTGGGCGERDFALHLGLHGLVTSPVNRSQLVYRCQALRLDCPSRKWGTYPQTLATYACPKCSYATYACPKCSPVPVQSEPAVRDRRAEDAPRMPSHDSRGVRCGDGSNGGRGGNAAGVRR